MAVNGTRVVAFTPYGRKVTVSILAAYMARDHAAGVLDEWQLWLNMDAGQDEDARYADELAETYDWVTLWHLPEGCVRQTPKQLNTGKFYLRTTDENTVYVRFDDDIVYVHDGSLRRLVEAKLTSPAICAFPIIWNNAIVSWHLQQRGIIPQEWGTVAPYCMNDIGWADGNFAVKMHELLLVKIAEGRVPDLFMYQDVQLELGKQFSVSTFACHGRDYAAVGGNIGMEEEHWHSIARPVAERRPNIIVGDALVSHLTFYPQRQVVLDKRPDILCRYRQHAQTL